MQKSFNYTFERVFNACLLALRELDMKIEYNNKNEGAISASTGTSIFSWGETVDIKILTKDSYSTVAAIKSTSNAQLIDWGKNEDNERAVLTKIQELLNR